ncbi:eEF1A lysine and N-terminal methyltransferase [Clupea harengus]|uniref:eEF1A lysine and N-terminal methyltransferase n=1 Tax=Clupea harengus TaxID=7950 RepID=A0A8M1KD73_CLUHA|nr:eEF1A lysine and N-terminal methyltransferase [Clupea harengus]
MSLLPRTTEELSSADYWERFFRKRGDKAFEWYGDYHSLCGVLHKYIKPRDQVLVVGCGNSELSEQLYDVGYQQLTNIDTSETVVSNMNQRNAERRPGLTFQLIDATQTGFEDGSYQVALDKSTLDAMASEEEGALAKRMLTEVSRVMAVGGRYVCVTLAQEHVVRLAVEHFSSAGWAIRLHCMTKEEDQDSDSTTFALPVFVLVCTKFRQPPPFLVLEMCLGEDGAPKRLSSVPELLAAVKERQAYALLRQKLHGGTDSASSPSLTLCHTATGLPRYTLTVKDSPPNAKVPRLNHFAIFIVPQGRESDWLYGSAEGRVQLASSANFRRLVIVSMHRDQEYQDMQAIQAELSPMVMELAPPGMPANQQVPFLSVGGDLGWRKVVGKGVSELTGEFSVEDVRGEDGHLYRRLIFLKNDQLVQSESRLSTPPKASAARKKKNKKKSCPAPSEATPRAPASDPSSPSSVDHSVLCCTHHEVMVAGLAMLGLNTSANKEQPISVLLVGLGGGGLAQFVHDFVPSSQMDVVELDPAVLDLAQTWFGFQPNDRLKVTLADGLAHITSLEIQGGHSYDVIMFDVDSKDPSLGMSCPPPAFVEKALLEKVFCLLSSRGVFMLNLVCRDTSLRQKVMESVREVFPRVYSRSIEGEVNDVLFCLREAGKSKDTGVPEELKKAAKSLQGAIRAHSQGGPGSPHIDIAAMLEDLRIA